MTAETIGIGSRLGGFQIESELGRGGMGVVYKAHELSLNRKVAIKVLSQRLGADEEFIQRFKREAQIIAAMNHPNIVNILTYGEEKGYHYFAMEYVRGRDLSEIMKEKGVMSLHEALTITEQVASALGEAASRGVVHRDLKPSNIMVDESGRIRVTDFGVAHLEDSAAQLTRTGLFLGTPEYASPEQATGGPLDPRSDIYSLGAVLYRMLSGRPPITGESPLRVVVKIATEPVTPIGEVNPSVPVPVRELIDRMMARDPNERYQTPQEVIKGIEACRRILQAAAAPSEAVVPAQPTRTAVMPKRRNRAALVGGIVGVALAVVLVVWIVEGMLRPQPPKPVAQPEPAMVQPHQPAPAPVAPTPAESVQARPPRTAPAPTESVNVETGQPSLAPLPSAPPRPAVSAEKPVAQPAAPPGTEARIPKTVEPKRAPVLPRTPTVLLVVSGPDSMMSLVRAHLGSILAKSGLRVASVADIPVLREKAQYGRVPMSWYEIRQMVPQDKTQVLVLAEIQKAGSTVLTFYGRSQEQITATFSIQSLDMASGTSVGAPAAGTVDFTALNMNENLKDAITSAAGDIGNDIKKYWAEKIQSAGRSG
jgi:predicted Ser/Thr protein kinase